MKRWLFLLGGPLIWAAHFLAIYATASISVQLAGGATVPARLVIALAGLLAAIAAALLAHAAWRRTSQTPFDAFERAVALAGAAIALIAIVWQTLPALL